MAQEVRTRIAPSPTGDWHLGNTRTALFAWLFARKEGGKFYLRIEDTDQARLVPGAVERLLGVLEWLGLTPDPLDDGRPYFVQSENLKRYREVVDQLLEAGKAYYCFATAEELAQMREEQQAAKQPPRYDNRWGYRDLPLDEAKTRLSTGELAVVRFKMPTEGETAFHDLVRGEIRVDNRTLDDHVLLKSDGFPTYHLAHIVDDHEMKITHVIRGDEWLPSAPRHVQLHAALGWELPVYVHAPVILGPDKGKLSKRHSAKPVFEYQQDGYLPEGLKNFLALLGWNPGTDQEVFSPEELVAAFSLERIQPSPAVFDAEKLEWFNGVHVRRLSVAELRDRLLNYFRTHELEGVEKRWLDRIEADTAYFDQVLATLRERLTRLSELTELAEFYYTQPEGYDAGLIPTKKQSPEAAAQALRVSEEVLAPLDSWSHDTIEQVLRQAAERNEIKAGDILWPVRVALTGLPASPSTFDVLVVLGKEESLKRIAAARAMLA